MSEPAFVVSCEHAGNRVPAPYRELFDAHRGRLDGHQGWDPGALELARDLARRLAAPLLATSTTRLLVDTNRSLGHRGLFSDVSRALPREERERIVARWWRPLRESVADAVRSCGRPVVHLSAHSFTPVLEDRVRKIDVAFLHDPRRAWERRLAIGWQRALRDRRPGLRVRRNAPYRGTSDGHTTSLRSEFPDRRYAGIEIEVNQEITTGDAREWRRVRAAIVGVIANGSLA